MVSRWFLGYVFVELAALVALAWWIGLGWTLLSLVAAFAVGVALAGSQVTRQLARLRAGLGTTRAALTDGTLVALGTILVVVPGLVTSAAGILLLLPPTRAAARPVLTAMAVRRIGRPLITVGDRFGAGHRPSDDVIDGEVIDVTDVDPPALPPR